MAIYSLAVSTVARADGQSAVLSAAYIRRDARTDQRTGESRDYSRDASDVLAAGIVGLVDWQAAERAERRKDAVVARTIIVALPCELSTEVLARIMAEYCTWLRDEHGVAAEWAVHRAPTESGGDERNLHGHILLSSQRVADDGTVGEKTRELDDRARGSGHITRWRQQWQDQVNLALVEQGCSERIDCRSLADRGIERPPTEHLGPQQTMRERRGYSTAASRHNDLVAEWQRAYAEAEQAQEEYERTERLHYEDLRARTDRAIAASQRDAADCQRAVAGAIGLALGAVCLARRAARQRCAGVLWRGQAPAMAQRAQHPRGVAGRRDDAIASRRHPDANRSLRGAGGRAEDQRVPAARAGAANPGRRGRDAQPVAPTAGVERAQGGQGERVSRDRELLRRAKREIDLAGFLGAHGWLSVPGKDSRTSRCLAGPDGSRVIISQAQDGHWQWFDAQAGRGGSIIDACSLLLGRTWAQTMAELRSSLGSPPPPLPVAGAGSPARTSVPRLPTVRVQPDLRPLGGHGRDYLVKRRHLAPATIDAFAHALRENVHGSVRVLHNEHGDGEERSQNWKAFVGSQADGEGRGRSLWIAFPAPLCSRLVVAESFISGLSAWELLPANQRMITGIASTGGAISAAGIKQLEQLLVRMREQHVQVRTGRKVWLLDGSDQGEARTVQRTTFLKAMADSVGVSYWRYAPRQAHDWNDALAQAKGQPAYRDAHNTSRPMVQDGEPLIGNGNGVTLGNGNGVDNYLLPREEAGIVDDDETRSHSARIGE